MSTKVALTLSMCGAFAALLALEPQVPAAGLRVDPGRLFTEAERSRLRGGAPVVVLPDVPRPDIAMVGAVRTAIGADRLIAWSRQSDLMYAGAFAPVGGRLSTPPRIEDFNRLAVSGADLEAMRGCEPGDCSVKLSSREMSEIRMSIEAAGGNWRPAGVEAFRRILVARATAYLAKGHAGLPPIEDHRRLMTPAAEFAQVLAPVGDGLVAPTGIDDYLRAFPAPRDGVESMLFWTKNAPAGAREVVNLTHVAVFRLGSNDVVVAEAQVYANHYLEASVVYLVLTGSAPDRYLFYFRRSRVDVLRGTFGGFVRGMLERRVRSDAPKLLSELRKKLESGDPPSSPVVVGRSR